MSRAVLSALFVFLLCSPTLAQFSIDSPTPGSVQSGAVAPPNGWKCPRNGEITARIDGGPPISFVEDLSRGDTAVVCGNSGNNGFAAVPWNWNVSGDGPHTVEFFDDNVRFATVTFEVATFGTEFLFGAGGQCTIQDFPDPGGDVEVSWDPAIQNFRLTDTMIQPSSPPPSSGSLNALLGRWLFSYTIFDTMTEIYDFQRIGSQDGTNVIRGVDETGGPIVAARIQDLEPGSQVPFTFVMVDPGGFSCDLFLFDQTSNNQLDGLQFSGFESNGVCDNIPGGQENPMTASRLILLC